MALIIFLALIVAGLILLEMKISAIGIASIIAAFVYITAVLLKKTFSGTKKAAKAIAKGIPEEVEKAEGQFPKMAVWEEGLKEAGSLTGKQLFAPGDNPLQKGKMDAYKWKFKGSASAASGVKKFADEFKKLLGM